MSEVQIPVGNVPWTLRCHVAGRGPTLVLQSPGWGTGGALYEQTFGPLLKHFTLVSYDPRGSGWNPGSWPENDLNIGTQAEDLGRVVDYLGLDQFSLLGHSHGAWISLLYAIRSPHRLRHLVLVGPEADHVKGFEEAQRAFIAGRKIRGQWTSACDAFTHFLASESEALQSDEDLVRWFRQVLPLYAHDPAGLAEAFSNCDLPPLRLTALRMTMRTNSLFPVMNQLDRIRCPTLALVGHDEWTGVRMLASKLVEGLPNGRLLEICSAGHFPWLEAPEAFFASVKDFCLPDASP